MNRTILIFISLFLGVTILHGQDIIKLEKKPKVILHSWYPEYKELPKLKVGESKLLFTASTELEKSAIRNNDIDLKTSNAQTQIEETEKRNQYIITVNPTNAKYIEFEVWLDVKDKVIMIKQNGKWKNITEVYTIKDNKILIDTVRLELKK
ncbi:hypothetical protein AR687_10415 [Flavobacteriaceae bacterium CRH]|nr:hypothetical protein AR687_10415 [Flavobacteriaceae bacterium CRH]